MQESENTNDATDLEAAVTSDSQTVAQEDAIPQEEEPGSQAKNFRELRRILKEQQTRIRELESVALSQRRQDAVQEVDEEEDDFNLNPDDIPTWKDVQKAIDRKATAKAKELIQQQHALSAEDRMRVRHRDYDEVVSEENVRQLVDDDPVVADTIRSSPDPYKVCYTLIKKSAFYAKTAAAKANPDTKRIQENAKKPVSSNAVNTERPITAAHSWSSMASSDKEALYREMQDSARRRI